MGKIKYFLDEDGDLMAIHGSISYHYIPRNGYWVSFEVEGDTNNKLREFFQVPELYKVLYLTT